MIQDIFITKYALTRGIRKVRAVQNLVGVDVYEPPAKPRTFFPRDYCETFEEAVAQAELARAKEVQKLQKKLALLEALDFTKPPAEGLQ